MHVYIQSSLLPYYGTFGVPNSSHLILGNTSKFIIKSFLQLLVQQNEILNCNKRMAAEDGGGSTKVYASSFFFFVQQHFVLFFHIANL